MTRPDGQLVVDNESGSNTTSNLLAMFSPAGKTLLVCNSASGVSIQSALTGKELRELPEAAGDLAAIFGLDGELVAARMNQSAESCGIWDSATGNRVMELVGHEDTITSLAFHPDGKMLLTGSEDGAARIWDVSLDKRFRRPGTPEPTSTDRSSCHEWRWQQDSLGE